MLIINFNSLYKTIAALHSLDKLQFYLPREDDYHIPLRGAGFLLDNLTSLHLFYEAHLNGFIKFDEIHVKLEKINKEIDQKSIDSGYLILGNYRPMIKKILNIVFEFNNNLIELFSNEPLLKFFNTTYVYNSLLFNQKNLFEQSVWDWLDEESKNDIIEASKALLFGLPNSSAIMMFRCFERCLRNFCNNIDTTHKKRTIGSLIIYVKKHVNAFPINKSELLREIGNWEYIKNEFRNPITHPERYVSQNEAQDLFGHIKYAIGKIKTLSESF